VPRAEFACGRVGDGGDVMVRPALRLLAGAGRLHGRQLLHLYDVEIRSSARVGGAARACASGPTHQSGLDLSCEAETCRGGSSSGKLAGDAADGPKTGHLAGVGLDQGLLSSLS
jgi:hypothetical protein